MHELGIIVQISKTLADVAEENHLEKIGSVTLEIGTVSWKFYCKKTPLLAGAKLKVEMIQAVTYCEHCEKTYDTIQYGKICPHCHSDQTYLISGNEINIKEIEAY